MIKPVLNFSKFTFRCSSLGYLMTNPKGDTPLDKYNKFMEEFESKKQKLLDKVDKAKASRDKIQNKETKTWKDADEKVKKYEDEYLEKFKSLNDEKAKLEERKDDVVLSKTCIDQLIKIYISVKYGRYDNLTNRYVKKGNNVEGKAITVLSTIDKKFYAKNKQRERNDFIEGECDIAAEEMTIDTKASWDIFTFIPKTLDEINKMYYWQGFGYMILFVRNKHQVAYVLIDTPDGIISDEKKSLLYKMGTDKKDSEAYAEACKEIELNSTYKDIPVEERVIRIEFEKNQDDIDRLYKRIEACRKWLNEYAQAEHDRIYNNKGVVKYVEEVEVEVLKETNININIQEITVNAEGKLEENEVTAAVNKILTQAVADAETVLEEPTVEITTDGQSPTANINVAVTYPAPQPKPETPVTAAPPPPQPQLPTPVVVAAPAPVPAPVVVEQPLVVDDEEKQLLDKIETLKTEDECVNYYKEIRLLFDKYPKVKETLVAKRNSYKTPETAPVTATAPAPQATAPAPKAAAPTPKPAPVIVAANIGENPTADAIKAEAEKCKTGEEVLTLYRKYAAIIDDPTNKALRDFMTKHGASLAGKKVHTKKS